MKAEIQFSFDRMLRVSKKKKIKFSAIFQSNNLKIIPVNSGIFSIWGLFQSCCRLLTSLVFLNLHRQFSQLKSSDC